VVLVTQSPDGTGTPAVRAQELRPAEVLKSRGLNRQRGSSPIWVLTGEAPVLKNYRAARGLATQLAIAQRQEQAIEMGDQDPKALIDFYRAQISQYDQQVAAIDQQLANLGPPTGHAAADYARNLLVREQNAIIREQRRLGTLIRNLYDQIGMQREWKWQVSKEVVRLREAYMQAIEDLRESVPKILKNYAELGKDEGIRKALAALSVSSRTEQKLGPSRDFQAAVKWLERTESLFQSDTVELHREGGIDHIDALLDGKTPVRMVFDTGAGPTMIPAGLASELGLKPTGRTVSCQVADGSRVTAKIMVIPSIRVGKLTIKNVVCAVLPTGDVPPLLGQIFLRHFDYKYAQGSGRLVLTKVEQDQPAFRSGPPGAGTRGQSDRPPPPRTKGRGSRRRGEP
jgi:hypothetical protein